MIDFALHDLRQSLEVLIASREQLIAIYEAQQTPATAQATADRIAIERELLAFDQAKLAILCHRLDDLTY